jgi:hypothetical protein
MADAVRDILKKFPGIQFEVLTFLGDRIGELTGETALWWPIFSGRPRHAR